MEKFTLQNKIKTELEIDDVNEDLIKVEETDVNDSDKEEETQFENELNKPCEDEESDDTISVDGFNNEATKNNKKYKKIRSLKPVTDKCRFKCAYHFPLHKRENICKKYWSIEYADKKKDFIIKRIEFDETKELEKHIARCKNEKPTNGSLKFFFFKKGKLFRVCRSFFLLTLSISYHTISNAIKKAMKFDTILEHLCFDKDAVCGDKEFLSDDASLCEDMSLCTSESGNRDPDSLLKKEKETRYPKAPKDVDCSKCLLKCTDKFTYSKRENICKNYWRIEDSDKQTDYIIQRIQVGKNKAQSRYRSLKCFFFKNGAYVRVCIRFFRKTLCISDYPIKSAIQKINANKNESTSSAIEGVNSGTCLEEDQVGIEMNKQYQQKDLDFDSYNVCGWMDGFELLNNASSHDTSLGPEKQNKFNKNLRVRVCRNFKTSTKDVPIRSSAEGLNSGTSLGDTQVDIKWDQQEYLHIDKDYSCRDDDFLSDDASSCDENKPNNTDSKNSLQNLPVKRRKKTIKPPKTPKPVYCNCRLKCAVNFPYHKRENICKNYYKIKDASKRIDFIAERMQLHERKIQNESKRTGKPTRKVKFFFFKNRTFVGVCRQFFRDTLSIGDYYLSLASERLNPIICQLGDSET